MEPTDADIRYGGIATPTCYFRPMFKGTLMVNQDYDRDLGNKAITSGNADLVAYGKLYIANPDLPERFKLNTSLNQPDPATFYGGDEKGYIDYPALKQFQTV